MDTQISYTVQYKIDGGFWEQRNYKTRQDADNLADELVYRYGLQAVQIRIKEWTARMVYSNEDAIDGADKPIIVFSSS
jgi:hypothetical protein